MRGHQQAAALPSAPWGAGTATTGGAGARMGNGVEGGWPSSAAVGGGAQRAQRGGKRGDVGAQLPQQHQQQQTGWLPHSFGGGGW